MIFLDTDILLDIAWRREPFHQAAAEVLTMAYNQEIIAGTTPVVLTNIYYLLSHENSNQVATAYINKILKILQFIPVTENDFKRAFTSEFKDKEDAVNHYAAQSASCDTIITRNVRDFSHSQIRVITAEEFVSQKDPKG